MNKELLKGTLNIILLLIISKKKTYGYEISNVIYDLSKCNIKLKESSLYTALIRLEKLDYIKASWEDSTSYPRRKYYEITEIGTEFMKTNLNDYFIINKLLKELINKEDL